MILAVVMVYLLSFNISEFSRARANDEPYGYWLVYDSKTDLDWIVGMFLIYCGKLGYWIGRKVG